MNMKRMFDESVELTDNAMLKVRPGLFNEWDFEKNDDLGLDVYKVTRGLHKTAWWKCRDCKESYDMLIANKVGVKSRKPQNCPYCAGQRILKGFNDMWTTNPRLALMLANPEDGYKYTQSSGTKVDWKCLECANITKNKIISDIKNKGFSCPSCSDKISFPEKFIYNLLKKEGISFETEKEFNWSLGKRYDFYFKIKDESYIIEVHGIQHYENSNRGRLLKEEQENDRVKEELAKDNEVDAYIIIDARESTVEWMKESVLNSDLTGIVGDIDFEEIGRLASNSFIKIASDLWSEGNFSVSDISAKMAISKVTIRSYLKRGAEIGWCDYDSTQGNKRAVVQFSFQGELIKEWETASEAARSLKISGNRISSVCAGLTKTTGGFIWMYKDISQSKIESQIEYSLSPAKNSRKVIQLTKEGVFLREWNSTSVASKATGIMKTGICQVCIGNRKTAGGFKWIYKEDYDIFISNQIDEKEIS